MSALPKHCWRVRPEDLVFQSHCSGRRRRVQHKCDLGAEPAFLVSGAKRCNTVSCRNILISSSPSLMPTLLPNRISAFRAGPRLSPSTSSTKKYWLLTLSNKRSSSIWKTKTLSTTIWTMESLSQRRITMMIRWEVVQTWATMTTMMTTIILPHPVQRNQNNPTQ